MTRVGVIEVVQKFQNQNASSLSFRKFLGVVDNSGSLGLGDTFTTDTEYSFDNTGDWFPLKHSGTIALSRVRGWQGFPKDDPNQYNIKATSFRYAKVFDSSQSFDAPGIDLIIGGPFPKQYSSQPAWIVLTYDDNGNGLQDIALGKAVYASIKYHVSLQYIARQWLGWLWQNPKVYAVDATSAGTEG